MSLLSTGDHKWWRATRRQTVVSHILLSSAKYDYNECRTDEPSRVEMSPWTRWQSCLSCITPRWPRWAHQEWAEWPFSGCRRTTTEELSIRDQSIVAKQSKNARTLLDLQVMPGMQVEIFFFNHHRGYKINIHDFLSHLYSGIWTDLQKAAQLLLFISLLWKDNT